MNTQDENTLEQLLDRHGLPELVDALAGICVHKVMHLEENWQDRQLAGKWARTASKLAKFHSTLNRDGTGT